MTFQNPPKAEETLGRYENGPEAKRDWPNSYESAIGMMLYTVSNERPDISFAVYQFEKITHNTKASHEMSVKIICRYLQGTKNKGLMFNP